MFLAILFGWLMLSTSAVLVVTWPSRIAHAVVSMGSGLVVLWVALCGGLMLRFRRPICEYVRHVRLDWRVKFVLFCTLLAMLEEAITTSMTNLAPVFGLTASHAHITASSNYLDVILFHSVCIFVSWFAAWALILNYFDFPPFAVFLLFGITGTVAEAGYGGPQQFMAIAMWIYVYGLMIWLPACCVPTDRGARRPPLWVYPLTIPAMIPALILFPFAGVIHLFSLHHPSVHFPPIRG